MNKYTNALIYKIINNDYPDLIYVGSTTDFSGRGYQHKADCNKPHRPMYNSKVYKTIREHGSWDSWEMIKICDFPCENRTQLIQEEERQIEEHSANLNVIRAYTAPREKIYKQNNKELVAPRVKIYKQYNKELAAERGKIYRQNNKEKLQKSRKIYHDSHKEQIKKYHLEHIEHKRALEMVKFDCVCGGKYTHINVNTHLRTQKHINFIEKPIEQ
jgi:hypothetical protein